MSKDKKNAERQKRNEEKEEGVSDKEKERKERGCIRIIERKGRPGIKNEQEVGKVDKNWK